MMSGNNYTLMNSLIRGSPPSIFGPWTNGVVLRAPDVRHHNLQMYEAATGVILRLAKSIKHLSIYVDNEALQMEWTYSTLREMINQGITPEALVPRDWSANKWGRSDVAFGCLSGKDERNELFQCFNIVSCACGITERRTGFSALRRLHFGLGIKDGIKLLVSLLSLISSQPDSPFECLFISGVRSEHIRAMKREELGEKCGSLWPRLRRLSVSRNFYVYDTEDDEYDEQDNEADWDESDESVSPLSSIVGRCSNLHELTLSTDLETPLDLPGLLPTLRVLIICCDQHDSLVEPNFPSDIVSSGRLPALQSLYMQIPHNWSDLHERKVEQLMKKLSTDCDSNNVSFVIQKW